VGFDGGVGFSCLRRFSMLGALCTYVFSMENLAVESNLDIPTLLSAQVYGVIKGRAIWHWIKEVETMQWPSQSPDLSLTEVLWLDMKNEFGELGAELTIPGISETALNGGLGCDFKWRGGLKSLVGNHASVPTSSDWCWWGTATILVFCSLYNNIIASYYGLRS